MIAAHSRLSPTYRCCSVMELSEKGVAKLPICGTVACCMYRENGSTRGKPRDDEDPVNGADPGVGVVAMLGRVADSMDFSSVR